MEAGLHAGLNDMREVSSAEVYFTAKGQARMDSLIVEECSRPNLAGSSRDPLCLRRNRIGARGHFHKVVMQLSQLICPRLVYQCVC